MNQMLKFSCLSPSSLLKAIFVFKVLEFLEMLGKAKHEPSGEFWETR